jgi:hypothetical protein
MCDVKCAEFQAIVVSFSSPLPLMVRLLVPSQQMSSIHSFVSGVNLVHDEPCGPAHAAWRCRRVASRRAKCAIDQKARRHDAVDYAASQRLNTTPWHQQSIRERYLLLWLRPPKVEMGRR